MPKIPDSAKGAMTGATEVILVPNPGASVQNVFTDARFENKDTVQHTITAYLKDGANQTKIAEALILPAGGGAAPLAVVGVITVKSGETLVAVMEGAHTTTAPRFWSSWITCS